VRGAPGEQLGNNFVEDDTNGNPAALGAALAEEAIGNLRGSRCASRALDDLPSRLRALTPRGDQAAARLAA
jgi:hypothetical protein